VPGNEENFQSSAKEWGEERERNKLIFCYCIVFDGVVIAAQCTATF
jgi:hypothetical protein